MPIIKFTAADINRSKTLEAGWYPTQITKLITKTSSAGDSINYELTFLIEGADGKEVPRIFNTKAMGFAVPLINAVLGRPIKAEEEFELETIVNKKVDSKLAHRTYNGQILNDIVDWVPYGTSKQQSPF